MGEVNDLAAAKLSNYLRETQGEDGGWPLFHAGEIDVSATVKAYYALKMAGDDPGEPHMKRAREAILSRGGAARANVFTRLLLALFEQVPWRAVPVMPVEIMLLPRWFPFHMNKISYWSRTTIAPLLILIKTFTLEADADFVECSGKHYMPSFAEGALPLPLGPIKRPDSKPLFDAAESDYGDVELLRFGFKDWAAGRSVLICNLSTDKRQLNLAGRRNQERPVEVVGDNLDCRSAAIPS